VLAPPKSSDIEPARVFHAMLARVPIWPIDWKVEGIDGEFFVRAIDSYVWVTLNRAIAKSPYGPERTAAEHALFAHVIVDADCCPVFGSPSLLDEFYGHEVDRLSECVYGGLSTISPVYASCDVSKWLDFLSEGATAPENWNDMLSLGKCYDVSFGFAKGAAHVKHEPEAFFGFPRREMLDCHWLAYHASIRVRNELK
jgi:hypothetical protein